MCARVEWFHDRVEKSRPTAICCGYSKKVAAKWFKRLLFITAKPLGDEEAVPVLLYGDTLHVDSGRRRIPMIQGILRLRYRACLLGHYLGEGVPGLRHVEFINASLFSISLQVLDVGV